MEQTLKTSLATSKHTPPPRGYLTLRIDVVSGLVRELGELTHQKLLGLSFREVRLILIIQAHPKLTMSRLVELSFMEKTMASKAVTRLTRVGVVERQIGDSDARHVALRLTRKGQALADKAGAIASSIIKRLLSGLSKHEQEVFDDALDKLRVQLLVELEAVHKPDAVKANR